MKNKTYSKIEKDFIFLKVPCIMARLYCEEGVSDKSQYFLKEANEQYNVLEKKYKDSPEGQKSLNYYKNQINSLEEKVL